LFAFRLAIYDPNQPEAEDSSDPLGLISEPIAWRIFLLHHWEFIDDDPDPAPEQLPSKLKELVPYGHGRTIAQVTKKVMEWFPDLILPDNWSTDDEQRGKFHEAHEYCKRELAMLVEAWKRLKTAIAELERPPSDWSKLKGPLKEAYPRLIRTDPRYRDRWLALLQEGYLVSAPFHRRRKLFNKLPWIFPWFRRKMGYDIHDIPDDPRKLEPYVIRAHYFLETLELPEEKTS
jgi:hypothetical protein